ncbi:RapZ C-terminal domain-containing protein [Streptacidiphilus sp. PAMC 29251]
MDLTNRQPHLAPGLIRTVITSYGEGHNDAPGGDALRVDTRPLLNPPEDPAVRRRMLHSNGLDSQVRDYVLNSPGAERLISRNLRRILALLEASNDGRRIDIHVACGGGRHRSVVVSEELAARIRRAGHGVEAEHRHIDRPLLPQRPDLTDHEHVALQLLARGHTHTQTASLLKIRPQTAGQLLNRARILLHARTLPHAVAIGYATGLLGHDRAIPEPPLGR